MRKRKEPSTRRTRRISTSQHLGTESESMRADHATGLLSHVEDNPLKVLGAGQDVQFNDLAELAAAICWTPMSQVNLLDEHRTCNKGAVGFKTDRIARDVAFCQETVQRGDGLLIVNDAEADARFASGPLVTGHPHIRFYAGVPVFSPSGDKVGALCVLDTIRRELKPWQVRGLRLLAQQVDARIELAMRRHRAAELSETA